MALRLGRRMPDELLHRLAALDTCVVSDALDQLELRGVVRAIEAAGHEQVMEVANSGRVEMAGWGGLLSRAAVRRGIRGVIADGSGLVFVPNSAAPQVLENAERLAAREAELAEQIDAGSRRPRCWAAAMSGC